MKIQFIIKHHTKNTYVNTLINDLIDTSLLFNVNIEFNLFKDKNYNENKLEITPNFYSNEVEEIPQGYLDFHGYYLENYVHNKNIDIALINVNQY
ncbi:MAG: hypothetical protein GY932_12200 [Arcobacter sp.]|nr:hypothetical protein [Arcobacter sp.]